MKTIFLIQLGLGGVGRALVEQVFATRDSQACAGIELRYSAIADSQGALVDPGGLEESVVESAVRHKARGGALHDHEAGYYHGELSGLLELVGQPGTLIVDTTAAPGDVLFPLFDLAMSRGYPLVLANKKPLTASWEQWERLTGRGLTRYEATVGAGLPVIRTMRYLMETGDKIRRVEGAFSGTLGFLMSELDEGRPFGASVREAKARGWTEPDPRDDLSGTDVARKALILARTVGLLAELSDVHVTPLYPADWDELSLSAFMERLDELDAPMREQRDAALAVDRRLRYAASIAPGAPLTVGPLEVEPGSALGALRGSDNLVAFHTDRYKSRPLVIQGAGAGVAVTASAVLGDIFSLARRRPA